MVDGLISPCALGPRHTIEGGQDQAECGHRISFRIWKSMAGGTMNRSHCSVTARIKPSTRYHRPLSPATALSSFQSGPYKPQVPNVPLSFTPISPPSFLSSFPFPFSSPVQAHRRTSRPFQTHLRKLTMSSSRTSEYTGSRFSTSPLAEHPVSSFLSRSQRHSRHWHHFPHPRVREQHPRHGHRYHCRQHLSRRCQEFWDAR